MKRVFSIIFLWVHMLVLYAQDNTIVIMQTGMSYSNQVWFCSGSGNELQKDKIKKYWDEDKYITSAAYTRKGWLVTMAEDCGYTDQLYFYSSNEPWDWVKSKWDEDYYITTISSNSYKWLVVMSKGTGYTGQTYKNCSSWPEIDKWISEKWEEGYYITQASCNGKTWSIVMSETTEYVRQGYFGAGSDSELSSNANKVWKDDYYLTLIEYGNGAYFAVFSQLKDGNTVAQSFNNEFSDVDGFVQKNWDKSMDIAYIGGGYQESSSANGFVGNYGGQTLTGGYYIGPIYCPPLNTQAIQQGVQMAQQQAAWNTQQTMKYLEEGKKRIEAQAAYNVQHGIAPMGVGNTSSSSSSSSTTRSSSSVKSSSIGGKNCRVCAGTGRCKTCSGQGWYYNPLLTNAKLLCPNCHNHDGKCTFCGGKGHN